MEWKILKPGTIGLEGTDFTIVFDPVGGKFHTPVYVVMDGSWRIDRFAILEHAKQVPPRLLAERKEMGL